MRLKGILITAVIILSVLFAVTNWQSLTTNLPVNLFFFPFELPLGLLLLLGTIGLCSMFFFISLIDRASQLRRITHLERQIEALQNKLGKKRLEELASIEDVLATKIGGLTSQLETYTNKVESLTSQGLANIESRSLEKFKRLEERVLLVRNELAADIAGTEDILKRQLAKSKA